MDIAIHRTFVTKRTTRLFLVMMQREQQYTARSSLCNLLERNMKFSVIIPTYNRVDFLEKAIQSVISQTYQNYEIVVVNDNPADKEIIEKVCHIVAHVSYKGAGVSNKIESLEGKVAFAQGFDEYQNRQNNGAGKTRLYGRISQKIFG